MTLALFIPITKVDEQKRLVHGIVAEEIIDKSDEIFDYASSKPLFAAWSEEIAAASEGRSVGNLRAMHGRIAAGKLTRLAFDDDGRRIEAVAKVVDDGEWRKVLEGVYTGFSIGGHYASRWPDPADPARTRYTAKPVEVSLVDNPCIPSATFSVIRADGSTELRKFKAEDEAGVAARGEEMGRGEELARDEEMPRGEGMGLRQVWLAPDGANFEKKADAERHIAGLGKSAPAAHGAKSAPAARTARAAHPAVPPLRADGDHGPDAEVGYADPGYQPDGKPRYPLKEQGAWSEGRIRAAWAYLHKPENQRPYSAEQLKRIKARVILAWKEHIDPEGFPSLQPPPADKANEPAADKAAAQTGMAATRTAPTGASASLGKLGARHSKADLARVNAIHRLAVELGAACAGAHDAAEAESETMPAEEDEAASAGEAPAGKISQGAMAKVAHDRDAARAEVAQLAKRIEGFAAELASYGELRKLLEALQAEPLPPKGALYVVDKAADGIQPLGGEAARRPQTPEEAIKLALARPFRLQARFGG